MKQTLMGAMLLMVVLAGCTRDSQRSAEELGRDVGRDIERGAQEVEHAAKDALD
ncbi:MAG: hypothetical protein HY592_02465 [Candidatus Omnitrophica bacterium]|nr:hypothetical protein [Candidatus Omnitrophota bacterium]